jgi:hypothetical protein
VSRVHRDCRGELKALERRGLFFLKAQSPPRPRVGCSFLDAAIALECARADDCSTGSRSASVDTYHCQVKSCKSFLNSDWESRVGAETGVALVCRWRGRRWDSGVGMPSPFTPCFKICLCMSPGLRRTRYVCVLLQQSRYVSRYVCSLVRT